jgi:transcription elongation factor GreA
MKIFHFAFLISHGTMLRIMTEAEQDNNYLTQEKFDELTKELDHLKTTRRREIAEQLEYARSLGDLSENAEYQEARDMQASTEERINKIVEMLDHAQIISHKKSNVVTLGSEVSIQKKGEKDAHLYEIVGSAEADMQLRKISHQSPLGSAMMGKKKGESFEFETPKGKQKYKITSVT